MSREYQDYLEDVREWGGDPIPEEEFNDQMREINEVK